MSEKCNADVNGGGSQKIFSIYFKLVWIHCEMINPGHKKNSSSTQDISFVNTLSCIFYYTYTVLDLHATCSDYPSTQVQANQNCY